MAGDPQLAQPDCDEQTDVPHLSKVLDATPRTDAMAVDCEVQPDRRRRGSARAYDTVRHTTARDRATFPALVPEAPRAFKWMVNGRQPALRIGLAIVRPKGAL